MRVALPVQVDAVRAALVEARMSEAFPIPEYAMLDVWMALGGDPESFDRIIAEERRTWADTWAQLMAAVRGDSFDADTNPPAGPEFDRLLAVRCG